MLEAKCMIDARSSSMIWSREITIVTSSWQSRIHWANKQPTRRKLQRSLFVAYYRNLLDRPTCCSPLDNNVIQSGLIISVSDQRKLLNPVTLEYIWKTLRDIGVYSSSGIILYRCSYPNRTMPIRYRLSPDLMLHDCLQYYLQNIGKENARLYW